MKNNLLRFIAVGLSAIAVCVGTACVIESETSGSVETSEEVKAVKEYYISTSGSDSNDGSANAPFLTLMGAFEGIKSVKDDITEDVVINVADGYYHVNKSNMLKIDGSYLPKDKAITVRASAGASPVFGGGITVDNWSETTLNGKSVLVAQIDKNLGSVYNLTVNGVAADIAKSIDGEFDGRNLSTQNANGEKFADGSFAWDYIDSSDKAAGIAVENNSDILASIVNPAQTQAVWLIEWKECLINIDSIRGNKITSSYWGAITGEMEASGSGDSYYPAPKHRFYLQNDVSFVTAPGEFCYEKTSGKLYYYPRENESASSISAQVPLSASLIDFTTTVKKGFIKDITFEGITFADTTADFVDKLGGFAITQAQTLTIGEPTVGGDGTVSYSRGTLDAAIKLSYCRNVKFTDCTFRNLGLSAIKLDTGTQNCIIEGCRFVDMGNCAVVVSNPNIYQAQSAMQVNDNRIENNYIRRVGRINLASPAVLVYYTNGTSITHNDIYDCPYTAVSVGWGWAGVTKSYAGANTVAFNRIGNYMTKLKDGGGLYTLGIQPGSVAEYNYFYSQKNNIAAIYLDEGTSGYTVRYNAVDTNDLIGEDGKVITENYAVSVPTMFWLNLNDLTGKAGTASSPMFDINVVSNYYYMKNGYGKTVSHPDNIIPPVLNEDKANPSLNNKSFDTRSAFLADSSVSGIIGMAGLEADFRYLASAE